METVTFITGNLNKVKHLEKYLGFPIKHVKLDLDEIQSLDTKAVIEHKVRQAYGTIKEPVLVEDTSLEFAALGRLPGPFIKFFMEDIPLEMQCRMIGDKTRKAVARSIFGYFDGTEVRFFEGRLEGKLSHEPLGDNGWDWDKIFIPDGYTVTRAQMNDTEYQKTAMMIRPLDALKKFLETVT